MILRLQTLFREVAQSSPNVSDSSLCRRCSWHVQELEGAECYNEWSRQQQNSASSTKQRLMELLLHHLKMETVNVYNVKKRTVPYQLVKEFVLQGKKPTCLCLQDGTLCTIQLCLQFLMFLVPNFLSSVTCHIIQRRFRPQVEFNAVRFSSVGNSVPVACSDSILYFILSSFITLALL